MTEPTDIDSVLRESFARIAEPGDPAGVADAIRSRLASGDIGTPAQSSGFGGGGLGPWLLGGAIVVVAALGGGAIGASGLVGTPPAEQIQLTVLAVDATTDAYDCPSGSPVSTFTANERTLVVARTEDSAWLAVRDSYDYSRTVWLPASVVSIDAGQGELGAIAVGGCAEPVVVVNTPAPVIEPDDTTRPSLTSPSAKPDTITSVGYSGYCGADVSTVSVNAVDNVGVKSVTATWSDGSATLNRSGSVWSFIFSHAVPNDTVFEITLVAKDAAGNVSAPVTTKVTVTYCLI